MRTTTTGRAPRRRSSRWVALAPGVRLRADLGDEDPDWARMRAWAERLPDGTIFTGLTAAAAYGLWLSPLPPDRPVEISVPRAVRVRRPQVDVTRHRLPPHSHGIGGVRIATVPETVLAAAGRLGLLDLTVLVDGVLHEQGCTRDDLDNVARGRRGGPRLREALALADARSESPWESLLRLLHVACGVPVEPQAEVRDDTGRFVARADLLITGTRTLQEYDGAVHRDRGQYARDRRRDSRLADAGYVRHGYVAPDVRFRAAMILREADEALGRTYDPTRLDAWYALWRGSLWEQDPRSGQNGPGDEPADGPD
ncbi:hypothetical protein G5C66_14200 [Nocardioides sp. KC13]|uniref:DUF559 domain-containing protein n=1 Tax=Nocardioides turkmenicus TaxID=2711220 RepID=A0A6M1QVB4_9ACTN|nr:hypothetical protein [Nocardioides sp. KC13]NGN93893.1 hypothetical protein [Nocardioides sp. KC13]